MNHLKSGLNTREEANLCQVSLLSPKLADDPKRSLDFNQISLWQLWLKFVESQWLGTEQFSPYLIYEVVLNPRNVSHSQEIYVRYSKQPMNIVGARLRQTFCWSQSKTGHSDFWHLTQPQNFNLLLVHSYSEGLKTNQMGCFEDGSPRVQTQKICSPANFSRLSEINNTTKIYWTTSPNPTKSINLTFLAETVKVTDKNEANPKIPNQQKYLLCCSKGNDCLKQLEGQAHCFLTLTPWRRHLHKSLSRSWRQKGK